MYLFLVFYFGLSFWNVFDKCAYCLFRFNFYVQFLCLDFMEIKKVLRIDSPVHLYRLIDDNMSMFDGCDGDMSIRLRYFVDLGADYVHGCPCEEVQSWESLEREYNVVRNETVFIDLLCSVFECDSVNFSEEY